MQVTPELLSVFPCLKPLPDDILVELARHCTVGRFARRAVVLNAGQQGTNLCFLFEGNLQGVDFTIDGREVGLYFVERGDFCGELGMFDDGPQPEFVIARTPATVVFVPIEKLREISIVHAHIANTLARRLANRLRELTRQRSLLALSNVGQRVCAQLWQLIPEAGRQGGKKTLLTDPPTHMELAIMLSLSREAVSRVFQALQSQNIVSRDGPSRLLIRDPTALQAYAEGKVRL